MYDGHIYCEEYSDLKDIVADLANGYGEDVDIEELSAHIQELWEDGKMSSTQYDDLMRYIQDMGE